MPPTLRIAVITPEKSFTHENRHTFKGKVMDALDEGANLIIDLTDCRYMDSNALGCLVTCQRLAREAGRRLLLVGLNDDLFTLFELTKLDRFFTTALTVDAATRMIVP